jgi:hypothetical protein
MKTLTISTLAVLSASLLGAAEPVLTQQERDHAIQLLRDSETEFFNLTSGLSEAQWTYKPAPDRWSVGETAEHIVLAEGALLSKLEEAVTNAPNPDWEAKTAGKTEFIERVMPDRSHKAQAPEPIQPHEKWKEEETIARYKEVRARTLRVINDPQTSLKNHTSDHPFPVFGTLNAYQWLIYIPLHNVRHNQQIAEVKNSPGFPKP